MKPIILLNLLCAIAFNVPVHAQMFAASTGMAAVISPVGVTSVIQNGSSGLRSLRRMEEGERCSQLGSVFDQSVVSVNCPCA